MIKDINVRNEADKLWETANALGLWNGNWLALDDILNAM